MRQPPRLAQLGLPAAAAALIGLWSFAPGLSPGSVPFWPGAEFTDLMTAHLPVAAYIQRALSLYGRMPAWNPTILSGMPVLADPLSSLAYPPHWPLFVWPTATAATLLAVLHGIFGSLGLAAYLRRRERSTAAVTVAAIAFAGMPKLIGHFALGHLTTVYAVSWTPWLLLCCDKALDMDGKGRPSRPWAAAAGAVWGITALADIRWAAVAGFLGLGYLAFRLANRGPKSWPDLGRSALVGAFTALLLPSVHLIPLWYWWRTSTRSALTMAERLELSLPPVQLIGLLLPPWAAWPEWITYFGVSILMLGLIALVYRSGESRFWWSVVAISILASLGNQLPVIGGALFSLPGLSGLRVPPRFLFAAGIGFSILAAGGIDSLSKSRPRSIIGIRRLSAAAIAVGMAAGALILLPSLESALSGAMRSGLTLLALVVAGSGLLLLIGSSVDPGQARWLAWAWAVLIVIDLGVYNWSLIEARRVDQSPPILEILAAKSPDTPYRVFSPSLSIAPYRAAESGFELAGGIHPLIYEPYWAHMAGATGFDPRGYSVTLPPLPSGDPHDPWGVNPDAALLGRLNVLYMVSAYEVSAEGWDLLPESPTTGLYAYRNQSWRPRAWVELAGATSDVQVAGSPGEILIKARGPGRLVVSELSVPGWRLTVDDQGAAFSEEAAPLTAVQLESGEHVVEMRYRTPGRSIGMAGTLLGLLLVGWAWWRP